MPIEMYKEVKKQSGDASMRHWVEDAIKQKIDKEKEV